MKDNMFDREVTGYRSGALDTNRLYKSQMNSDRLFKRKQERQNKKYNVVLLIDESGSMGNTMNNWDRIDQKYTIWPYYESATDDKLRTTSSNDISRLEVAADVSSLLVSGLEKNNIDFAIVGYNAQVTVHKEFDKPLKFGDRIDLRRDIIRYCCGMAKGQNDMSLDCNHDLFAVQQAKKMLKGRSGTNIVMIFSDGRPNCDYSSCEGNGIHHGHSNIDKVKAEAHKLQKIATVLTFGIGTAEVANIYPNCEVVNTAEEFMDKSINALNKLIKRG